MNEPVRVEISADGTVLVALRGSVVLIGTHHVLSLISRALHDSGSTKLRLDLAEATSLDSSGVAVIVLAWRLAQRAEIAFSLDNVRPEILEHLRIAGVSQLLGISAQRAARVDSTGWQPGSPRGGVVQIVATDFDERNLEPIRQTLGTYAATCGLGELERYKFVLAATEIMVNSVLHGGGRGHLRAWRDGADIWVEVSDHGCGMPADLRTGAIPLRSGPLPRSGLWLVRTICSTVDIESDQDGTTVRIAYQLPRAFDD